MKYRSSCRASHQEPAKCRSGRATPSPRFSRFLIFFFQKLLLFFFFSVLLFIMLNSIIVFFLRRATRGQWGFQDSRCWCFLLYTNVECEWINFESIASKRHNTSSLVATQSNDSHGALQKQLLSWRADRGASRNRKLREILLRTRV